MCTVVCMQLMQEMHLFCRYMLWWIDGARIRLITEYDRFPVCFLFVKSFCVSVNFIVFRPGFCYNPFG